MQEQKSYIKIYIISPTQRSYQCIAGFLDKNRISDGERIWLMEEEWVDGGEIGSSDNSACIGLVSILQPFLLNDNSVRLRRNSLFSGGSVSGQQGPLNTMIATLQHSVVFADAPSCNCFGVRSLVASSYGHISFMITALTSSASVTSGV
ncbi:hypothetical protein EVAR_61426_1 [Eumeta japonica]|uniref:Uncharacterized protein n=1 Tax=Eumeta variegata TaxID=151549 RepID=A0A4C1Y2S4_EUMVA|nr:hypothetical protein EVAR_61426_1 [Eumeta japonica]